MNNGPYEPYLRREISKCTYMYTIQIGWFDLYLKLNLFIHNNKSETNSNIICIGMY